MARRYQRRGDDDDDGSARSGARPLWSGAVAFGIVSIPVRMFNAIREHGLHFHQISRADRRRIRYLKVAEGGSDEVPAEDIVKGYRLENGSYVVFDDDELERIAARRSQVIDIEAFVALDDIDPRFFDQPYYLVPANEAAGKPYRLLVDTIERNQRVGIARLVWHNKEHLVAIRGIAGILCLETLHYQDELVDPDRFTGSRSTRAPSTREAKMADQLVASMDARFEPGHYHDEHLERLRQAIARKAKGKTLLLEEAETDDDQGKVLDLMEALRRSVDRSKARKGHAPAHGKRGRHAG